MRLNITHTLAVLLAFPQMPQNPSPMTDSTRAHRRVPESRVEGRRFPLSTGTLLLPPAARASGTVPLLVHFHGAAWLAEWSSVRRGPKRAVIAVELGAGSGVYSRAFAAPERFGSLLDEAARTLNPGAPPTFRPIVVSSFSAGYGAVREILRVAANRDRIDAVILADSLHTGYVDGKVETAPLEPFVEFARAAAAGGKRMIVTHSEVFPGTFASTTETADYLLAALGLRRKALLRWGPGGMQQTSEARRRGFRLRGFAGNSAPDHLDHFHALEAWLALR